MNINGRLLLMAVAIGLFVRVWTTNDRPRARHTARAHALRAVPVRLTVAVSTVGDDWRRRASDVLAPRAETVPETSTIEERLAPSNVEAPRGNRKFDFTGYIAAEPLAPFSFEHARPDPVELPTDGPS